MMSTMTTTADVLRKAAEVIERDGWTRGVGTDESGAHCTIGALSVAAAETYTTWGLAFRAIYNGLRAQGVASPGIVEFNDAPDRTAEEVTALLRFAADLSEEETR